MGGNPASPGCSIRTPRLWEERDQLAERALSHAGHAVERENTMTERAQSGEEADRRAAVAAEKVRVPDGQPSAGAAYGGFACRSININLDAQLRQAVEHEERVIGEEHIGENADPIGKRCQHERTIGQALGARRRERGVER